MISKFFIDRPIFASVLSAVILIGGLASIQSLPIAQFPDILPPEVQVAAFYPGASAEVVAETVAGKAAEDHKQKATRHKPGSLFFRIGLAQALFRSLCAPMWCRSYR